MFTAHTRIRPFTMNYIVCRKCLLINAVMACGVYWKITFLRYEKT